MEVILLTLLATVSMQFGYFLWKLTADEMPRLGEVKVAIVLKAFLLNGRWLFGMLLRLVGLGLFIKATSYGDLSLIQPLMSAGDIFFVLLVVTFLHERLVISEWVGIFLVFLGSILISFEANIKQQAAIDWTHFQVLLLLVALIFGCFLLFKNRTMKSEVFWGITVGVSHGVSAVLIKLMTSKLSLAGLPVNFVNCLLNPILPCIIISNIVGIIFLQMAFQNGRAAIIFPVMLAVTIAVSVLSGIFLFFETVSLYRSSCIIVIVIGTAMFQYVAQMKRNELKC